MSLIHNMKNNLEISQNPEMKVRSEDAAVIALFYESCSKSATEEDLIRFAEERSIAYENV